MSGQKKRIEAKASVILQEVFDCLWQNNDLKQFCWDKFKSVGTVQLGLDPDELPQPDILPAILIGPVQRAEKGENSNELSFLIFVSVTISKGNIDSGALDNGDPQDNDVLNKTAGKRILDGAKEIEELREKVEELILTMPVSPVRKEITAQTLPENDFPIFRSATAVTFSFPPGMRGPLK